MHQPSGWDFIKQKPWWFQSRNALKIIDYQPHNLPTKRLACLGEGRQVWQAVVMQGHKKSIWSRLGSHPSQGCSLHRQWGGFMVRSSVSPAWPGLFWGRCSLALMGLCLVLFGQRWADASLGQWWGPRTLLCSNTEGLLTDCMSPCLEAEKGLLIIKKSPVISHSFCIQFLHCKSFPALMLGKNRVLLPREGKSPQLQGAAELSRHPQPLFPVIAKCPRVTTPCFILCQFSLFPQHQKRDQPKLHLHCLS